MKKIAFIFARGGSKGLPGKNIRELDGKPLIQYSIDIAKASPAIDDVYVSSDDQGILEVARSCGAKLIERPSKLASDVAPEWLAWQHAVEYVQQSEGIKNFYFVSLPCTSPLRSVDDVERAITKSQQDAVDVCISTTPANRSPYFNMVTKADSGQLEVVIATGEGVSRRQDAPEVFDITTVVYATTAQFVLKNSGVFDGCVHSIDVPKERAADIDDIYDFWFAEAILRKQRETKDA